MEIYVWMFVASVVFTFYGMYVSRNRVKKLKRDIVEHTITQLQKEGYLRYVINEDGETVFLKYNEQE